VGDFPALPSLHKLTITHSNLTRFLCSGKNKEFKYLRHLDLSHNRLQVLDKSQVSLEHLEHLSSFNLSHNQLHSFHKNTFHNIKTIKSLDISHNQITDPQALKNIPTTIKYLDISENPWPCSPSLSWMWSWSRPLVGSGSLHNSNSTQCLMPGSKGSSLLSVMEAYSESVLPACPPGCSCRVNHLGSLIRPRGLSKVEYNVAVNCSGLGLELFPKLPDHTKKLDLSNNSLSSASYEHLDVVRDNYERVQYLNISHNQFDSFNTKLQEIMLRSEFTATHNQITNIPYDFSKHLQKNTKVILLGNNPWICGCNAEININAENNQMLKNKIEDLENIFCGVGSVPESINQKQLMSIKPMVLCPPEDDGSLQEAGLQVLCVVFSLCIILVLARLLYDYWLYKNRGKLPWIVLKMP